ncbi:hypothetical protein RIR_e43516_A0A2N0QU04_9GLOM [Rhizophagus irregularis DAOM 181602=DAOM 197198]|nr:hypothetical protein RIR_e43516_A0A2N0QU04_9GLOM [Rhizophagus irregularis DAOM 181602=DAOM 197198]
MIMMEKKKNLKPKNTEKFDLILIWPIFFNIFFFFFYAKLNYYLIF